MSRLYILIGKRVLDICSSLLLLIITLPVQIVVAALILIFMGRPVYFLQERAGLRGNVFVLRKFRTMNVAESAWEGSSGDSKRMTKLGSVLRETSLDELPGLWNVLLGHMSMVGPRPLLIEYLPRYSADQARRHNVRPGVTGLAQIMGRNSLSWNQKFALDAWYVDHLSLGLDLRILLRTVPAVLRRGDVSATGHATVPEFNSEV